MRSGISKHLINWKVLNTASKYTKNSLETLHGTQSKELLICFGESTSHFILIFHIILSNFSLNYYLLFYSDFDMLITVTHCFLVCDMYNFYIAVNKDKIWFWLLLLREPWKAQAAFTMIRLNGLQPTFRCHGHFRHLCSYPPCCHDHEGHQRVLVLCASVFHLETLKMDVGVILSVPICQIHLSYRGINNTLSTSVRGTTFLALCGKSPSKDHWPMCNRLCGSGIRQHSAFPRIIPNLQYDDYNEAQEWVCSEYQALCRQLI